MAAAVAKEDYTIKPEAVTPSIPTSEWPLLLKNYDKRMFPTRSLLSMAPILMLFQFL